jgi:hypothetical protein
MASKVTWADSIGLMKGKLGDVVLDIRIIEANRATVYEKRKGGIQELLEYQYNNYTHKGIRSVIYGVHLPLSITTGLDRKVRAKALSTEIYYAIFCEDGFIINEQD